LFYELASVPVSGRVGTGWAPYRIMRRLLFVFGVVMP
jgi:hypothetical protein